MKQIFFTLFLTILTCFTSDAQESSWVWAKGEDDKSHNTTCDGRDVATDKLGNIYVAGKFTSDVTFGSIRLESIGFLESNRPGSTDGFIVKYDSSGNVLWAKRFGGLYHDEANSIAVDPDGNLFVTGWFNSLTCDFGNSIFLTNPLKDDFISKSRFFIAKYDTDGTIIWAKSATSTLGLADVGIAVITDKAGNAYVTGDFTTTVLILDSITVEGTEGTFIAKYNRDGNVDWAKSLVGYTYINDGGLKGIEADDFGNIYLTGTFFSEKLTIENIELINQSTSQEQYLDIFIAKFNSLGRVLWAKDFGGSHMDESNSIAVDATGNFYITGEFFSPTLEFGSTTLYNPPKDNGLTSDVFVAKFDSDGNPLWARSFGDRWTEKAYAICSDKSANVFITGSFESFSISIGTSILKNTSIGSYGSIKDIFIVQFDSTGNVIRALAVGGTVVDGIWYPSPDIARSITIGNSGNAFITGVFTSQEIKFGTITLTNVVHGYNERYFLANLSGCKSKKPIISPEGTQTICEGETVTIASNSTTNNLWNTGESNQSIIVRNSGIYTVIVLFPDGCAQTSKPLQIVVTNPPKPIITASALTLCKDEYVLLTSNLTEGNSWNTGEISQSITINKPGSYFVNITNINGCITTSTEVIIRQIESLPEITLQSDCDKLFLESEFPVQWFRNNEQLMMLAPDQREYIPLDSGFYHLEISNVCGTKKSNDIYFKPADPHFLTLPNVITPNGDAYNEFFVLDEKLSGSALLVINRWGKEVYSSELYGNNWNGDDLSSGTYYYVISNSCFPEKLKGILSIVR